MVKKFSVIALASLIALPTLALASAGPNVSDMERKIEELSNELNKIKADLAAQKAELASQGKVVSVLEDKSDAWDLAARIKFYGDFRTRLDYYKADTAAGRSLSNDSLWTNRFRLNMRVNATENVEFKARLAMFKVWGMESQFDDGSGAMWPLFDGNMSRTPNDSSLLVDRAIINWNNIGGLPMWFSIGRRPTTDGPPAQIRMGNDERMATPLAYMDYPFDGLTIGVAYNWPGEVGSGRVRFCYGRGFESGLTDDSTGNNNDMDFAGFAWDVLKKENRLLYVQTYMAFNLVNYPNFNDPIINAQFGTMSGMGDRRTDGNIWHTAAVYQDKIGPVNFFVVGGWSQTQPDSDGLLNDYVGMQMRTTGANTDNENGYSVYVGARYDIDSIGLKLGAEFNWGSENWVSMTPGHDDIYQSKLATRGSVFEIYGIYDLPTGEAISKYAKTFIRFGYQHYEYDYAGSGTWGMKPYDLNSATDRAYLQALGQDPVTTADQIYLTFEAYF